MGGASPIIMPSIYPVDLDGRPHYPVDLDGRPFCPHCHRLVGYGGFIMPVWFGRLLKRLLILLAVRHWTVILDGGTAAIFLLKIGLTYQFKQWLYESRERVQMLSMLFGRRR